MAEGITLAESTMPILGEGRVIRYRVFQTEPTEPAVGQVEMHFFAQATLNPKVSEIKGVVCGVRVEEVEDPLMQQIRYLDKLVDELARGKAMEKILRG